MAAYSLDIKFQIGAYSQNHVVTDRGSDETRRQTDGGRNKQKDG